MPLSLQLPDYGFSNNFYLCFSSGKRTKQDFYIFNEHFIIDYPAVKGRFKKCLS
jgi:hypothetical protein